MNLDENSEGKEIDLSKTREFSREEILKSYKPKDAPQIAEAIPAGEENQLSGREASSPPTAGQAPREEAQYQETAPLQQKAASDMRLNQASQAGAVSEQTRPASPPPDDNPPGTRSHPEKKKSKQGLAILGLAILFVLIVVLILTRKPGVEAPPAANGTTVMHQEEPAAESGQPREKAAPVMVYHELDDRQLWGWAQLNQGESEIFTSAADDARLAALMQALKNQADLFLSSRIVKKGEESIRNTSGSLAGCNLVIVETTDASGKTDLDVSLTTPARGSARSFNRRLTALKNLDLEQLESLLRTAGYLVEFDPEENPRDRVSVRLQKTAFPNVSEDFLIKSDALGRIELGTRVDRIEVSAPPGALVAMNRFRDGSRFQIIYKVYDRSQHEFLFAYEKDGLIAGLRPLSERYRTDRDIGLNSTLGRLLASYGRASFARDARKDVFALVPELNARLYFQSDRVDFAARRFPLDAPISDILIGVIPILGENR